ncbi:hypothetical protein ONS95_013786 [Cadophora gregata]|uniref:uncharacterized protein n=1 Tax=Cadophora gregata TaxID=51156 RepID=UPI0026DC57F4|nr:uncharacterized protein ONS95_013786 [Cadophora gregata]KAK0114291.1 hypothetical protein ONS95_013786 [Cadophora gregata]
MVGYPTAVGTLPNEILMNIFCLFPTTSLLPLTLTSHRIHDVILRIVHNRMLAAASIPGHQVILDVVGLQERCTLGQLRGLYSHFRPIQPEGDRKVWAVHPINGWRATTLDTFRENTGGLVAQNVDLESYEQFSQLQSAVNVVKIGPRKGIFQSCITVGEGLTRFWRNWLGEQAKKNWSASFAQAESQDERLLWSSMNQHTGLRLRVIERLGSASSSTRIHVDDDNVSYTLQYEELVVRTSRLLLQVEKTLSEEVNHEGKAMMAIA